MHNVNGAAAGFMNLIAELRYSLRQEAERTIHRCNDAICIEVKLMPACPGVILQTMNYFR
jgi:hypothetical protein